MDVQKIRSGAKGVGHDPSSTALETPHIGGEKLVEKTLWERGEPSEMYAKDATFRVRLISGGRITIPTAIRELLGVRDGDYVVCSVRTSEKEELSSLKVLWSILRACRRGLTNKEIRERCKLSPGASNAYLSLLVGEDLLSVNTVGKLDCADQAYRTTEKGLRTVEVVSTSRSGSQ